MDDLLLVDVVQALTDLANYRRGLGLFHAMALAEHLQQLSSSAVLD
jgi:hypothetical protein